MSSATVKTTNKPKTEAQLMPPNENKNIHDLIIIGSGPAALTAAIYTAREDIETLVIEKGILGGVPATVDKIENYPGFPEGLPGLDLATKFQEQAERFGVKFELTEAVSVAPSGGCIAVKTSDGSFAAKALLIASGCDNKKLGVPGEKEYFAKGVHYCATCDGPLYRDKNLVVIGGGNAAVQEALFLTTYAKRVDLLVRSTIKATDILAQQLAKNKKITVHLQTTVSEIIGDGQAVTKVVGTDVATNKKVQFSADGVFIFAGQFPNTAFLAGTGIIFDEAGYIQTDQKLQTALKGIFAAGDVRSGATRQIACATGEGATAAFSIREYLRHEAGPCY
jgi:thioredoxin reductase (NADPH)